MKYKDIDKLVKRYEEKYGFNAEDLLDNGEYDEYMNADRDYNIDTFALDYDIDLEERKKDHIKLLIEEDELVL